MNHRAPNHLQNALGAEEKVKEVKNIQASKKYVIKTKPNAKSFEECSRHKKKKEKVKEVKNTQISKKCVIKGS